MREIDRKKMKHTMRCLKNALFLTRRVTAVCGKQTEIGTVVFRTAIEAEILFAARVMQVRFLELVSGKTPLKESSSGKKIEAESAVPILVYLCIVLIVHKYRQSAKERFLLKRNTVPEVFPLTIGSGKTVPFEKRHAGCEEREKINRRRIYDTLRINFFEATKQTACIFSKGGDGRGDRLVLLRRTLS